MSSSSNDLQSAKAKPTLRQSTHVGRQNEPGIRNPTHRSSLCVFIFGLGVVLVLPEPKPLFKLQVRTERSLSRLGGRRGRPGGRTVARLSCDGRRRRVPPTPRTSRAPRTTLRLQVAAYSDARRRATRATTPARKRARAHTRARTHARTHAHARTHSGARKQHTRTHAHAHIGTRTHTNTRRDHHTTH